MFNTITSYTKAEEKAIKRFRHLADFYSETVGGFIFTFEEADDRFGVTFATKAYKFCKALTNTRNRWVFEDLTNTYDVFIIYKTKA